MKIVKISMRIFAILASAASLMLLIFNNKSEGELIGSTVSVLLSSIAIFVVSYLPTILMRRNVVISNALYTIIVLTILFSMGGGFIFRFYQIFNYYDTVIHFLNGGIIVIIAYALLKFHTKNPGQNIVPIIFVAVLVSISLGTIWEIYEFLMDYFVSESNMQRFKDVLTGVEFIGQRALIDTMVDLIVDMLGAILMGTILYFDSKGKRQLFNGISFDKIN